MTSTAATDGPEPTIDDYRAAAAVAAARAARRHETEQRIGSGAVLGPDPTTWATASSVHLGDVRLLLFGAGAALDALGLDHAENHGVPGLNVWD